MALFVCEEHRVAFEGKQQVVGHWNFHHTGKEFPKWEDIAKEELPDGFTLKKKRPKEEEVHKEEPHPARRVKSPPIIPGDADATRLGKMLQAIGVPDNEVGTIVNGFTNIPQFRNDPNALYGWLDTHISDKRLKSYIPLAVQEVFDSGRPAQPFFPYQPQQQQPYYFPPQVGSSGPFQQYQPYYPFGPPPQRPGGDPETLQQIQTIGERLNMLATTVVEERKERESEKREQEQRERDKEVNTKFEKLGEAFSTLKESLLTRGESTGDSKLDQLVKELKELREKMEEQKFNTLLKEIGVLKQQVMDNKPQAVGRTSEDIASELGPILADKFDKAGERLLNEMGRLREQAIPVAKEQAGKAMPRSIQEIAEVAQLENEIIEHHKEATGETTAEQPPPQQEPPQEQIEVPVSPPNEPAPDTSRRMRRMR